MKYDYQVRVSPRAKHLQIKITPENGVEVVVPQGHRRPPVADFVEANSAWIQQQLARLPAPKVPVRPDSIELQALNQRWEIQYEPDSGLTRLRASESAQLCIRGDTDNLKAISHSLKRWVKRLATTVLAEKVEALSIMMDCPYRKISIRGQKTRWGSCTLDNDISLNYKLLFLPDNLCRHVIIHELCHTREHNHSKRFWQWLAHFDDDCEANNHALKSAQRFIPDWIYY